MASFFELVEEFFREDNWRFARMDDDTVLTLDVTGKNGRWLCYARAREEQQQFVFYSVCPVNTPPNKRHAMAEFVCRANYGMVMGNFEFDFRDGEVRFKTSIDVENAELTPPLIKNMVYVNIAMMDKYFPGMMAIIYGNTLPEDAIEEIEGPAIPPEAEE